MGKRVIFTICLIISEVAKKTRMGKISFYPKVMRNISKCLQNNVDSKATSKYIVFCSKLKETKSATMNIFRKILVSF